MAKLEELEIERVDGVDEPATKQKFLILKAEEPDELRENVKQLLDKVEAALKALAKAENLELPDEAAAALNDVAKALDLDLVFGAKKKPQEEYGYPEYGYPEPKKPAKKELEVQLDIDELAKAVAAKVEERLRASAQDKVAKSRQPQAQDSLTETPKRKFGEGLFTNIVFGR